jgi:small conductance mechanosensitive channel
MQPGFLLAQVATDSLSDACGIEPNWFCEWVYNTTENETITQILNWIVTKPLTVIFIFAVAFVLNRLIRRGINRLVARIVARAEAAAEAAESIDTTDSGDDGWLSEHALRRALRLSRRTERSKQRAETLGSLLRSITTIVLYSVATFISLGEFDINLGPLIAGAGIVGVALGFGSQSLVKDFLSGVFMLVEDQYGVGDIIDVGPASGIVEEVSLRVTRLRDVHGTVWFIPNGEITRVGNKSQEWARAVLDIEVAYGTDIPHAVAVIKAVADSVWQDALPNATVLEEPEIWGVERFGDNSIAIRLVLKTEPGEQWATSREVRGRIKEAFDNEGIEIPFPQRTVWMHTMEPAAEAPQSSIPPHRDFHASGDPESEVGD